MPATSSRYRCTNARLTYPPNECPTRTYGPGTPVASSSACSSREICRARLGRRIAPAVSGTVVACRASELRHTRLHQRPAQAGRAHARFEDHSRCAFSGYVDVHPPLVESHEPPWGRKAPAVPPRFDGLVDSTRHHRQSECAEENHENHDCRLHGIPGAYKNTLVERSSSPITRY